jgi:hypothetical protein
MPKRPLPLNLPLKIRGTKGVISIIFITPLAPSYLKRGMVNIVVLPFCHREPNFLSLDGRGLR